MNHSIPFLLADSYIETHQLRDDTYRILLAAITDINLSLPAHQKLHIITENVIEETLIVAQAGKHLSRHKASYPSLLRRIWAQCTIGFADDRAVLYAYSHLKPFIAYTKNIPD